MLGEIVCGVLCQFLSDSTVNPVSNMSHIHPLLTMAAAGGEQEETQPSRTKVYQHFSDKRLPTRRGYIVFEKNLGLIRAQFVY